VKVLLDTNAYSRLMRGDPDVSNLVRRSERVLMSVVVVGELLFGLPGVEIGDSPR
jgi:predicted nucleic acid-binding protein